MKKALYPGSFDPITNGHVDILERASKIFDIVEVAILSNPSKDPLFTVEERVEMIKDIFKEKENIQVSSFSGLLVDYAEKSGADVIIRGLRAISDFEYEFQMALMNSKLSPNLEIIFMMPRVEYSFLSSKLVKEIYSLGGRLSDLVPEQVDRALMKKFHGS